MACWTWTVSLELMAVAGFTSAVLSLPRGRTKLVHGEESGFLIAEISMSRLAAVLLVTLVRTGIALALLANGVEWLSSTISVSELIMNTVALEFVLNIDESIFACFSPVEFSKFLQSLAPLPLDDAHAHKIGISWRLMFSIFSTIGVVSFAAFYDTRVQTLEEIYEAACGGNLNFVIGVQSSTGSVYATQVEEIHPESDAVWRSAVHDIIHASSGPREVRSVNWAPNEAYLEFRLGQSTSEVALEYTSCVDLAQPWPTAIATSLRALTGNTQAAECEDVKTNCTGIHGRIVRMNCPVTCGCANPSSGLYFNKEAEGCPAAVCQSSSSFQKKLAELPCTDPSAEELLSMPGWHAYWAQWVDFWSQTYPDMTDYMVGKAKDLLHGGCQDLKSPWDDFCTESAGFSSLRAFCPVECGCKEHHGSVCPISCQKLL
eukprot:TRINITY_DN28688_c0_g1_i1.p1 TRINITY_DN28688_c0_g1~~TRINITY_DN28688_c0_g1_i1.p1  ORF type:complete len:460 (+),score=78.07 TRINITY_DN28688_c0_g1_i1:89-1381(+)